MTTKLNMLQVIDRKLSGVIATTDRKAQLIRKINATLDHAISTMDAETDKNKWITTESGSHIKVDGDGNSLLVVAGAGGKFNGKPLSSMGGTKKFTKYETNAERNGNTAPLTKNQKKVRHWDNAARVEKTIEGKREQAKFKKFVNSAAKKFGDENILGVRKNGVVEVDAGDGTDEAQLWVYSNDSDRFYHLEDSDIKKSDTQIGKQTSNN